ncbi:hypothetical protein V6N13_018352 [Hibiscus sabdariffa]
MSPKKEGGAGVINIDAKNKGCGGILREEFSNIRILFSGPVESDCSHLAEVLAIFHALAIFREAGWIGKAPLIVESDSVLALTWINDKLQRSWRWRKLFRDIDSLIERIASVKFEHVSRARNTLADSLAKAGMFRGAFFKAWCGFTLVVLDGVECLCRLL